MNKLNKHIFLLEAMEMFLEREELRVLRQYTRELKLIHDQIEERLVDIESLIEDEMAEELGEEQLR